MEQELINWAIALLGCLGGWVLKVIWDAVRELQKADKQIIDRVSAIEILVAGKYVTREDFEKMADKIYLKLDGISDKLNSKADK